MGHVRNYDGDVFAYKRAKGFNVLHQWAGMLSACRPRTRNGAQVHRQVDHDNIATMRSQLKSMGLSLDWSREFATCDVEYYHQQQKLFLDFYEKGSRTAALARSTGTQSIRRYSRTSR